MHFYRNPQGSALKRMTAPLEYNFQHKDLTDANVLDYLAANVDLGTHSNIDLSFNRLGVVGLRRIAEFVEQHANVSEMYCSLNSCNTGDRGSSLAQTHLSMRRDTCM